MTKKRNNQEEIKRLPRFHETAPFDPDEFVTAFNWAMNAGAKQAIVTDPTKLGLNITEDDGTTRTLRFTDTSTARVLMAFRERYGDNPDKYIGAAGRFFALLKLVRDNALSDWIESDPSVTDFVMLHPAVVEAAAVVRLNKNGSFPRREFLNKIKHLANTSSKD